MLLSVLLLRGEPLWFVIMSTKDLRIYFHATLQRSTRRMPKSPLCVRIYEVVYMVAVLTLRPYAPLILLLRCQSNFLAIRTECAELWNRCVCMLQATSWGALADWVCGGYDSPNVCIDPFFLPPMLVNRWGDGRQATGLRKNEREGGKGREREREGEKNRGTNSQSCIKSCRHDRWVAWGIFRKTKDPEGKKTGLMLIYTIYLHFLTIIYYARHSFQYVSTSPKYFQTSFTYLSVLFLSPLESPTNGLYPL